MIRAASCIGVHRSREETGQRPGMGAGGWTSKGGRGSNPGGRSSKSKDSETVSQEKPAAKEVLREESEREMALGGPAGSTAHCHMYLHVNTPTDPEARAQPGGMLDPTVAASGLERLTLVGFAAHWVWEEGGMKCKSPWSAGQLQLAAAGANMPRGQLTRGAGPFSPAR